MQIFDFGLAKECKPTDRISRYPIEKNGYFTDSAEAGSFYDNYKMTGMTFPMVTSKFGLPMSLFTPIATDIHIRYGRPVEVGAQEDEPSDEHVNEVFERYVEALQALFAAHASSCLPSDIAAKGLKIIRL